MTIVTILTILESKAERWRCPEGSFVAGGYEYIDEPYPLRHWLL
jgi:hypothetical protein